MQKKIIKMNYLHTVESTTNEYDLINNINITDVLTTLIKHIIQETNIFKHLEIKRILICIASNRGKARGGTYGKLVPLKFKDGSDILHYKSRIYAMPKIINNGIPLLYLVYFYSPKFIDITPFEKLRVIFHELYHISPEFNGDIRRVSKVKVFHGYSTKSFNAQFENDLHMFYKYISNTIFMKFLQMDSKLLQKNFQKIFSRRMKLPKPILVK